MLNDLLNGCASLPDVWGEGAIFAFSGMDGPTDAASRFVATFGAEPCDLLIHTPRRRVLELRVGESPDARVATGDVLGVETGDGELLAAFTAWHTLVAALPEGAEASLRFEDGAAAEQSDGKHVCEDDEAGDVIVLVRRGRRMALSFGRSRQQAEQRAEQGLEADVTAEAKQRLARYADLPAPSDASKGRLLAKCFSVMRVNTLGPEAAMQQRWSTPDRVPHRHMWLWDSAFHSLGMNRLDPQLAWEFLTSMLETEQKDGRIPGQVSVTGDESLSTQPPLLAWAVWENYRHRGGTDALEYALPLLEAYVEWDCAHRDSNGNGLLEWQIESNPNCRSGESGLDNSPRFDEGVDLEAVDFAVYAAREMGFVARIAGELGLERRAKEWSRRAERVSAEIHDCLWHEDDGFYYDRKLTGELTLVRAATGFLPLLLEDLPQGRADRLAEHLDDGDEFNTAFPVPSVSASHPAFSTDMWRGPTWVNLNYMIVLGLRLHGRREPADRIAEATVEHLRKYYEDFGVIFEFFDSTDRTPPPECDRKGERRPPYDIREKMDSIRDYHWSAALTAALLLEAEER